MCDGVGCRISEERETRRNLGPRERGAICRKMALGSDDGGMSEVLFGNGVLPLVSVITGTWDSRGGRS